MRVSVMNPIGIKITFSDRWVPVSSGFKDLVAGTIRVTDEVKKPVKFDLTKGETSSHCSCKKRFETPLSYYDEDIKSRSRGQFWTKRGADKPTYKDHRLTSQGKAAEMRAKHKRPTVDYYIELVIANRLHKEATKDLPC